MENDKQQSLQRNAKIIYVLYMVGIIIGLTTVIGVVMAYINKKDAPGWLKSHFEFQANTFWYGMLFLIAGSLLSTVISLGYVAFPVWAVWVIIRSVKGMKLLDGQQPQPDPKNWLF